MTTRFSRILRRYLAAGILASMLALAWPKAALGHANLVSSEPDHGSALAQPPESATLEFSEGVDPAFARLILMDAGGQVLLDRAADIDPSVPTKITLPLPPLQEGAYSLTWRVRSTVDGHITEGVIGFSVGLAGPRASLLPPPGAPDPATAFPAPADTLLRWMSYIAAALLAGSLFFGLVVWRPVARRLAVEEDLDAGVLRTLKSIILAGLVGLALATIGFLLYQVRNASQGFSGVSPGSSPAGVLFQLLASEQSRMVWLRMVLLAVLAWLAPRLPARSQFSARPWAAALGLAAVLLLTFSLQSHAAALGSIAGVLLDWLHLLAMGAWLGGLPPLLGTLVEVSGRRPDLPRELVPRFSRVALVAVFTLAITGLYSALLHVRTTEALAATSYGRSLAVKVMLFALLVALGAVNLLAISPRLRRASSAAAVWLRRTVRVEMALGLLVLLAAGLLAGLSPAFEALEAQKRQGFVQQARQEGVQLTLRVAPARVGENEFGIDVVDPRPGAVTTPAQVLLRLRSAAHDMGTTQIDTTHQAAVLSNAERFTARGSFLSIAGDWEIEVIVRRAGFDDIRHSFLLHLPPVDASLAAEEGVPGSNPVPASAASLAAGQALYEENCLSCHGPEGKGDGPVGLTLNPRPVDLTQHALPGVHPDEQLFEWISRGYPNSVMPAFEGVLTEEQIWHLVNFLRTLPGEGTPAPE